MFDIEYTRDLKILSSRDVRRIVNRVVKRTTPFVSRNIAKIITENKISEPDINIMPEAKAWNIKYGDLVGRLIKEGKKFGMTLQQIFDTEGRVVFKSIPIPAIYFKPVLKIANKNAYMKALTQGKGTSKGTILKQINRLGISLPVGSYGYLEVLKGKKTPIRSNKVFFAQMKSGKVGLWVRTSKKTSTGKTKIIEVRIITPTSMIRQKQKFPYLAEAITQKITKEFNYAYDWYVMKRGRAISEYN